ncbi:TlpA disulfide reductase family protein [Candidatus Trichorickettsia mobilis]|uniref:TlpA disulfide reductase family protein n=1 Tax=Candidatus Trichorickettsia mobilis TaxID=1346319 RepID=UPI00374349C5
MLNNYLIRFLLILLPLSAESSVAAKITEIERLNAPDDVAFFDENGQKHFIAEFDGKTLLLTFWATWCASCTKEMPDLDMLQKDFRKLPFAVIAVSQDFQGIPVIKKYFEKNEIRYLDIYHDYRNQLFNAYAVVGLPTSFLINQEGKIVLSFTGIIDWYNDEIRQMILSHIPGDPPEPKNSYKAPALNQVMKPSLTTKDTQPSPQPAAAEQTNNQLDTPPPATNTPQQNTKDNNAKNQ